MLVKLFFVFVTIAVAMSAPQKLLVGSVDAQQEWTNWKTQHSKSYDTPEEEARRLGIFKENLDKILEHNKKYEAGEVTWTQGLNQFADLTQEEFAKTHLGAIRPKGSVGGSGLTGAI